MRVGVREILTRSHEDEARREIRREEVRRSRHTFAQFLTHLRSIEEYQSRRLRDGEDAIAPGIGPQPA